MKTVTFTIPEPLDEAAAAEARRRGISKSELIRRGLQALLVEPAPGQTENPWVDLAGFATEGVQSSPGEVDRVIYGP